MKIYTYYQDIDFSSQQELIDLWKISWSRQGYEPIVLNLEDAKKHPYFETLNREMRRIFNEITGKQISDYGMSCWLRWLAYSTQVEEKFYVSDYDAINVNFSITEPNDKLNLMDSDCPFLASGTPVQFENLCKAFIEVSNERIDILKQQANHYHDQEFFIYNLVDKFNDSAEELRDKYNILMTRHREEIGGFYDPVSKTAFSGSNCKVNIQDYKVTHIAHHNVELIFNEYPELRKKYSKDGLRIIMIKDILNIK
jgi:hypothetical protein